MQQSPPPETVEPSEPPGQPQAYQPPYPPDPPYPATLTVDYPDKPLSRLTTFFRFLWLIPIAVIAGLLGTGTINVQGVDYSWQWAVGGVLFAPVLLMILFRKKYPRWWYDWNLNLSRFVMRVVVYAQLLRDEYPSTDEEQAVHLDFPYPDAQQLNRWLPLVKWLLAIPHWIVLFFMYLVAFVFVVIAWFAILFTGRYPVALFSFVVSVNRWMLRVMAYAVLLVTDKYPPFRLEE